MDELPANFYILSQEPKRKVFFEKVNKTRNDRDFWHSESCLMQSLITVIIRLMWSHFIVPFTKLLFIVSTLSSFYCTMIFFVLVRILALQKIVFSVMKRAGMLFFDMKDNYPILKYVIWFTNISVPGNEISCKLKNLDFPRKWNLQLAFCHKLFYINDSRGP